MGVVQAVGVGILISIVLFIRRMGDGIIRADNDATRITSNVLRNAEEQRFLQENGRKIRIIEIEGALFFGTTDQVEDRIQSTAVDGVKFVILDMRRITDVDSGRELTFAITSDTNVLAKGATKATKAAGGSTPITTFVHPGDAVSVSYREADGKMMASEVRVRVPSR